MNPTHSWPTTFAGSSAHASQRGESDRQITAFLVSRYGDVILMKPPLEPGTYLLWFGPLLILVLGGAIAGAIVVRARKRLGQSG